MNRCLARLLRDESGAFGILFALLLMPMLILGFTAIDFGMALRTEGKMQQAADSATAAAVKHLGGDRDLIESAARQHLDNALPDNMKGLPFELEIGPDQRSVALSLETTVPTTVIALTGIPSFRVRASSQAFVEQPVAAARPALPADLPPDLARTIKDMPQTDGGSGEQLTREQQEALQRVTEEVERMVRDALSQLGR